MRAQEYTPSFTRKHTHTPSPSLSISLCLFSLSTPLSLSTHLHPLTLQHPPIAHAAPFRQLQVMQRLGDDCLREDRIMMTVRNKRASSGLRIIKRRVYFIKGQTAVFAVFAISFRMLTWRPLPLHSRRGPQLLPCKFLTPINKNIQLILLALREMFLYPFFCPPPRDLCGFQPEEHTICQNQSGFTLRGPC